MPSCSAMALGTRSPSARAPSETNATPSAKRSRWSSAVASARRVLPEPPMPTSVNSRHSGRARRSAISLRSRVRPTSVRARWGVSSLCARADGADTPIDARESTERTPRAVSTKCGMRSGGSFRTPARLSASSRDGRRSPLSTFLMVDTAQGMSAASSRWVRSSCLRRCAIQAPKKAASCIASCDLSCVPRNRPWGHPGRSCAA